jgi:cellulose synthase (UDP-forming)
LQTDGDFMLILEAGQIPSPNILDRTLAWFADAKVAIVQTPQDFGTPRDADRLGTQSPLFYGPVQRGRDGWNAAFFCGSIPLIRREALMQLGIVGYVREAESTLSVALRTAGKVLTRASRRATAQGPAAARAISSAQEAVKQARRQLSSGASASAVAY